VQALKYRTIETAKKAELAQFDIIEAREEWRPKIHITPPYGLLNDPNGFCFLNGRYHLFYQWYPFGTFHGMKHWYHVTSDNLITWHGQGCKISPIESYESHGAYSGAAMVEDGNAYLFYTGNIKNGDARNANQCVAVLNDSGEVTKSRANPVIKSVPEGYTGHVRDPKVIKRENGYYMLLGAQREKDLSGCLIVYFSTDMTDWVLKGELELNTSDDFVTGYMFECPDLLSVDGHEVLIFSPQGVEPDGTRFHNRYNVVYCVGAMNWQTLSFTVEHWDELDRGFDFYAPQTLANAPGKQTLVAWAGTDEHLPSEKHGWINCLTLARELSIKNGKLSQYPNPLLSSIKNSSSVSELGSYGKIKLESLSFALSLNLNEQQNTIIKLVSDCGSVLLFSVDYKLKTITLDRSNYDHHGDDYAYGAVRQCRFDHVINSVDFICDESILEIYINDGEQVFTSLFFPESTSHYLDMSSLDESNIDIKLKYLTL